MIIREATEKDTDGIWDIFEKVVKAGDTYTYPPDTPKEDLPKYWFAQGMKVYVADDNGFISGTYFIRPNQPGLGAHIGNCGYMVHPEARGKGVGGQLGEHSKINGKAMGFTGIQFNFVVSTNTVAVKLWQKCGFRIIGTIPNGYRHLKLGFVDAYIMFQELN